MFRRVVREWVVGLVQPTVQEWIALAQRDLGTRLAAAEEENAQLKKKLSMAMGAVQAATAQILQVRGAAEEAQGLARQAMQRATSAQAAAEAAAEGVSRLEEVAAAPPAKRRKKPGPG